ncbi:hypothetical protein [Ulvibacter antarcticus]|nr:hypothetical protein [Ulvibacter antarcticus]
MEKLHVLFYQKLGELFYAIAASDKIVRKAEYKALQQMVLLEWKNMDDYKDSFQEDAAYQIEIVFDWFEYDNLDANECFKSFTEFYKQNTSLFSKERKKLIWKTANVIANSFSGMNKSELIMLGRLKLLFS